MAKINLHNYEIFFLDYAEGRLTAKQMSELEVFLNAHPHLKSELEGFEILTLPDSQPVKNRWLELKKPGLKDLKSDPKLRDAFFVAAVENRLNPLEEKMLRALIFSDRRFEMEYTAWQKTILPPGNEVLEKESFFEFGLDCPISDFNYEYYLIARTEGLLNAEQNAALEEYARTKPRGVDEIQLADGLKLEPPRGVFYVGKNKLYKKKSVIHTWQFRSAAAGLIAVLSVFAWMNVSSPFAEKAVVAHKEQPDTRFDKGTKGYDNQTSDTLQTRNLTEESPQENGVVEEADPAQVVGKTQLAERPTQNMETIERHRHILEKIDRASPEYLAINTVTPNLMMNVNAVLNSESKPMTTEGRPGTTRVYNSIQDYAGDLLADKLNISENEKDNWGMGIAKRLTARSGELLDAEFTKQPSDEGAEALTYTFRIGNISLSHTKGK